MTWRERIAGRIVVASISGGKDSAAMSLWLTEQGIEHRRVFADTGWEHPATYEYLRGPLAAKLGPIDEVRSEVGGMVDWVLRKAMFPSRRRRYCTTELKVVPLSRYVAGLGCPTVNAVGIRAGESRARSMQPEWEPADDIYGSDCLVWRPLIRWNEEEVIAIHRRHGLPPNPLYLRGASRVGCWPCIFARKSEIAFLADQDPGRIVLIRDLERSVELRARARYAARGETFESLGYQPPTFYQAKVAEPVLDAAGLPVMERVPIYEDDGDEPSGYVTRPAMKYPCWPIDTAVEWARTARGGRQFELFEAETEEAGCVRWGLCEAAPDDDREVA